MAGELHVEVVPWGVEPQAARALAHAALEHPAVQALDGAEARVLSMEPVDVDEPAAEPPQVRATVYDYGAERALLVDLPVGGGGPAVASTARQPLPSDEEREAALAILRDATDLGPHLRDGRHTPYRPTGGEAATYPSEAEGRARSVSPHLREQSVPSATAALVDVDATRFS